MTIIVTGMVTSWKMVKWQWFVSVGYSNGDKMKNGYNNSDGGYIKMVMVTVMPMVIIVTVTVTKWTMVIVTVMVTT